MLNDYAFLEHARVFDHYYGTARRFVEGATAHGHDLILDIDVQGGAQVMLPEAISIFDPPPSREELERRLRGVPRSTTKFNAGCAAIRLASSIPRKLSSAGWRALREIENFAQYDYILVNDQRQQSIDTLKSIVEAERFQRCGIQPAAGRSESALSTAERARRPQMMSEVQKHPGNISIFPVSPALYGVTYETG